MMPQPPLCLHKFNLVTTFHESQGLISPQIWVQIVLSHKSCLRSTLGSSFLAKNNKIKKKCVVQYKRGKNNSLLGKPITPSVDLCNRKTGTSIIAIWSNWSAMLSKSHMTVRNYCPQTITSKHFHFASEIVPHKTYPNIALKSSPFLVTVAQPKINCMKCMTFTIFFMSSRTIHLSIIYHYYMHLPITHSASTH